ncbi:transaldolase [Pochonia chlamydosporia 170]|uniref:Transaldolase n=1 Tax=Pochonia chlamydosporia 170 TaxID=1380566 RepID=A0A179FED6_METCM|nr:transaldolase [Pochonia chlamydosporia 170]OAQ63611.1 transaldolase [Pochonia chlamydosporia 170]
MANDQLILALSFQRLAYFELKQIEYNSRRLLHHHIIAEASIDASALRNMQGSLNSVEFLVEILMVKLQLPLIHRVTGHVHISTNPKLCYSTRATVANAHRLLYLCMGLDQDVDLKRICIDIPATWEGIMACGILQKQGIATLATAVFSLEQAALAALLNCTYVSLFINELKVHFRQGYVDYENTSHEVCRQIHALYMYMQSSTEIMAASFTSVQDVMDLAGTRHIIVSQRLLYELRSINADAWYGQLGAYFARAPAGDHWETRDWRPLMVSKESAWKLAFARSGFGRNEAKTIQAINYLCDFQDQLEQLVALIIAANQPAENLGATTH